MQRKVHTEKSSLYRLVLPVLMAGLAIPSARASIVTFTGGLAAQGSWRNAVGTYVFEGFESFSVDNAVNSLSALGLILDPLAAGVQSGIYEHRVNNTPSGQKQLANFPGNCCITGAYQFGDLLIRVDPTVDVRAFAFWYGDPQGDSILRIYDRSNVLIGTATASINTGSAPNLSDSFAGFISTEPVGRLEFEGLTGDGWNHYDDFHVSFGVAVPEPGTLVLVLAGLGMLGRAGRRRNLGNRPR